MPGREPESHLVYGRCCDECGYRLEPVDLRCPLCATDLALPASSGQRVAWSDPAGRLGRGRRFLGIPGPARRSSTQSGRTLLEGRVVYPPDVLPSPRMVASLPALLLLVVLVTLLLRCTETILQTGVSLALALLVPVLPLLLVLVVLGRLFGGHLLGLIVAKLLALGIGIAAAVLGLARAAAPRPSGGEASDQRLVMRLQGDDGRAWTVDLRGHGEGVRQGDVLRLRGVRLGGVMRAAVVRNLTAGRWLVAWGWVRMTAAVTVVVLVALTVGRGC